MTYLLGRLLNLIRPRQGWLAFLLTWTALLCTIAGVQEARWVLPDEIRFIISLTLAGGFLGLGLARSPLKTWAAALISSLCGIACVAAAVGRVLPHWSQWGQTPPGALLAESWTRLLFLGGRLSGWWSLVRAGEIGRDNIPFLLMTGLAFWAAAILIMWGVYRLRRPLIGLLPGGAILALNLYYSGEGAAYLLLFLACGAFLLPWMRFITLAEDWEKRGVDYSPEVRLEIGLLGLGLALAVVLGGALVPSVRIRPVGRWVWEHWPQALKATDEGLWRVFGGVRHPGGFGGMAGEGGGMPRAHLLGASADLKRRPVMTVATDDPPPPDPDTLAPYESYQAPQYYWRAMTYDRYTGRGWENGMPEERRYEAGQSLPLTVSEGRRELRQSVLRLDADDWAVYAAGDPLQLDAPSLARQRGEGDLIGLETHARQYTVVSLVPEVSESALREAPANYPREIVERYLQLPGALPRRVRDLARQVTAESPTPYEKALALQAYLRQFDYSLEVEPGPSEQDIVDYFLFDVQTGYCDYYASAMVVMARTVGLPARLATGYASGLFDPGRGHYYVVEADAHSWPEIYFAAYGWIEFEPTAAQSVFEREGAAPSPESLDLPPRSPAREKSATGQVLIGLGALLTALALGAIWMRWPRLERMSGPALMADIYRRLAWHGARLGAPLRRSDTAGEYGQKLALALARRAEQPRWRWSPEGQVQRAAACLVDLERFYLKAAYSPYPLAEDERRAALKVWRDLHLRLWLICLLGQG